ncbi:MAG: energy-coupling factor transporter transmembrane protein EcfT [Firmicutes bacterium]|jgi:energy-coupling factor transport system permease protein|nr:energy-coupling factor transporter transmembrane protein EcfT [Bacillota bacterium]
MLYRYSGADSWLHRLDPRSKMVFVLATLIPLWMLPLPWPGVFILGYIVIIWVFGRIAPWEYWGFVALMVPLVVAMILIQSLSMGGPYTTISPAGLMTVKVSLRGFQVGSTVGLRLMAMGVGFLGFSLTTDPFHWGLSLYRWGLPYRAAFMFGFAMRFFPLIQEELHIIRNALKARAWASFGSRNPIKILGGAATLVVPLGLGALRRSQGIALSMDLRGFSIPEMCGTKRNIYREVGFKRWDYVVLATAVAVLGLTFYWRVVS